jgi:hypothetical protein
MTIIVVIPNPLGYCMFVGWPRQRLRACMSVVHPSDLRDTIQSLGEPVTVVLIGRRYADAVSAAALDTADLVIVPEAWLRRVPRTALAARANAAARFASAHRAGQIEQRLRRDLQMHLPF